MQTLTIVITLIAVFTFGFSLGILLDSILALYFDR